MQPSSAAWGNLAVVARIIRSSVAGVGSDLAHDMATAGCCCAPLQQTMITLEAVGRHRPEGLTGTVGGYGMTEEKRKGSMRARNAAVALAIGLVMVTGLWTASALAATGSQNAATESATLEQNETMPNFFAGGVVQSEYEQGFFVGSPAPSNIPSGQGPTLLGVAPTLFPGLPTDINPFYVLVPAWGCAGSGGGIACGLVNALEPSYNATFALSGQETCLPATIQTCWDHPSTIGVPNSLLGGSSGFTMVPLPGHDHLIASLENHLDVWWNIMVVLVFNQNAWPSQDAAHGITSVANLTAQPVVSGGFVTESLVQAELNGDVFGPVVTNTFLNFANLPPHSK
jgi:hypothetical protein